MFTRSGHYLFADGDLSATLDAHLLKVHDKVQAIPRDQFLSSSDQDILDNIRSRMMIMAITLHEDAAEMDQSEVKIDVAGWPGRNLLGRDHLLIPGFRFTVTVPFTGDSSLWKLRPSHWTSVSPAGTIRGPGHDGIGYLDIIVELPADSAPEAAKDSVDATLGLVKQYLGYQEPDIRQRNERLSQLIASEVQARRLRLEKQEGIAGRLNLPLKRKDGAPPIKPITVEKRLVRPLPPPPKTPFKAEPGIDDKDYEDILTIIRHEGRTFETTPSTYAVHDENDLRNILLAHLNGHYRGGATGETFRARGKTDIRIEDQDRAAFVAECKIWTGPADIEPAVTQLLGYLTWRDCKCGLVIFNKHNTRFSEILSALPAALSTHPNMSRDLGPQGEGEWRYVFRSLEDEARRVTLHVFLFNLYTSP